MNPTHMLFFVLSLFGILLLFVGALHRKNDALNEAITRVNQLDAEVLRLRGERNGLKTERDFLRDENAQFHALAPTPKKATRKTITARRKPKKAVE